MSPASLRTPLPLQTRLDRLFTDVEHRLSSRWACGTECEPPATSRPEWRSVPADPTGHPLFWFERAGDQWAFQKVRKHLMVGTANPEISLSSLNEYEPGVEVLDDWARWTDCVVAGLQGAASSPIGAFTYSLQLKWDTDWQAGQPTSGLSLELDLHDAYVRPAHRGRGVMAAMAYEVRSAYLGLIEELHPAFEQFSEGRALTIPAPVCANVVSDGGGAAARLVLELLVEGLDDQLHRAGWQRARQRHAACAFRNGTVTIELFDRFH